MHFVPLGGLVLASLISCAAASAQTLYRCGNEYRDTPCPGGKAVDTQDPRTPEQRAQTLQASAKEAALAEKMEKSRLAAEATASKRLQAQAAKADKKVKAANASLSGAPHGTPATTPASKTGVNRGKFGDVADDVRAAIAALN